ncbi:hypothetical protein [Nocardia testacea]|uniref:hypothetical protein n=1 Tax=Nocardia testacea TaxID=248551 RepID=UPI0012F6A92D|nr:hypothetical protein [Nocardia testacea]
MSNAGMSPVDDNVSAVTEQRLRSGIENLPYAMAEAGLNALALALAGGVGAEGRANPVFRVPATSWRRPLGAAPWRGRFRIRPSPPAPAR